jgi:hypothetical protein
MAYDIVLHKLYIVLLLHKQYMEDNSFTWPKIQNIFSHKEYDGKIDNVTDPLSLSHQ